MLDNQSNPYCPGMLRGHLGRLFHHAFTLNAASAVSLNGNIRSRAVSGALNAAEDMRPLVSEPSFALRGVESVSIITAIEPSGAVPVFNLSVERVPEFFANGILVHNCTWEPLGGDPSPDRLDAHCRSVALSKAPLGFASLCRRRCSPAGRHSSCL
jgi:hypothetical protein